MLLTVRGLAYTNQDLRLIPGGRNEEMTENKELLLKLIVLFSFCLLKMSTAYLNTSSVFICFPLLSSFLETLKH